MAKSDRAIPLFSEMQNGSICLSSAVPGWNAIIAFAGLSDHW